jgi:glucose-6-phosphate 1-epimerase
MSASGARGELLEITGRVRWEPGGLVRAIVTTPAAEAHVYRQGAHVTHYQPTGVAPVLFTSARSRYALGQPIRGGIPLVFPWFAARGGDPAAPAHGFARTTEWRLESAEEDDHGGITLAFRLDPDERTRRLWPHGFVVRYRIEIGRALGLSLEVANPGDRAITYEAAFHTYLAVSDVRAVAVRGLEGATYLDKTDGMRRKVQGREPLRLTGETDRVYLGTVASCRVEDPGASRQLVIDKTGSATTVVWNPWATRTRGLADLGEDEWTRMLCVETANAHDDAIALAPGARHTLRARLWGEPLRARE